MVAKGEVLKGTFGLITGVTAAKYLAKKGEETEKKVKQILESDKNSDKKSSSENK